MNWTHGIVLLVAFFLGAWIVSKYPAINIIGRIVPVP
jgi:hypothetical protein